jgi:hypothetical protein
MKFRIWRSSEKKGIGHHKINVLLVPEVEEREEGIIICSASESSGYLIIFIYISIFSYKEPSFLF